MLCAGCVFASLLFLAMPKTLDKKFQKKKKNRNRQRNAWKICVGKKKMLLVFFLFIFFLTGSKIKECGYGTQPPPFTAFTCASSEKKRTFFFRVGVVSEKTKQKIKQRLRNERQKPFTESCLRGAFNFFFLFFLGNPPPFSVIFFCPPYNNKKKSICWEFLQERGGLGVSVKELDLV